MALEDGVKVNDYLKPPTVWSKLCQHLKSVPPAPRTLMKQWDFLDGMLEFTHMLRVLLLNLKFILSKESLVRLSDVTCNN